MKIDFTEAVALGALDIWPIHQDPVIFADLTKVAPACGQYAPRTVPGVEPYRCSRSRGHEGNHVAGTDTTSGRYIAEWDEDRSTDRGKP